jgi:hypothetical protein
MVAKVKLSSVALLVTLVVLLAGASVAKSSVLEVKFTMDWLLSFMLPSHCIGVICTSTLLPEG